MVQPKRIATIIASCGCLALCAAGCDELGLRLGQGARPTPKRLDQTVAAAVGDAADDSQEPVTIVQTDRATPTKSPPSEELDSDDEQVAVTLKSYEEWTFAETALDSLGRIGEPAVALLMESLDDPSPLIRYRAAKVLARIGPDALEAVPALVRHLNDVDTSVRREAARALGQIGPQAAEAVPHLIDALKSEDAS